MFYCDECAKRNDWPMNMSGSFGRCEMCGKARLCNDVPSSRLPLLPQCEHVDGSRRCVLASGHPVGPMYNFGGIENGHSYQG